MNSPSPNSQTPSDSSAICLVTGGSSGIGRGICRALSDSGYTVGIHYRSDESAADSLIEEVQHADGQAFKVYADLTVDSDIVAMMETVSTQPGTLHALINNAGWESVHHAIDMPRSEMERALQINLLGPFRCAQLAARLMEHTGGVIVNNLSIHDTVPRKGLSHYCAAKAGMLMLTRCLALEWAEFGIRVVGISPGAIETEMNRHEIEQFGREKFNRAIPAGRIGNIGDISGTIAFLVSDAASYITGTTLYSDGGYMLTTVPYDPRPPRTSHTP